MPINNDKTSIAQPSTQNQNVQSSFTDLIKYSRKISPLTNEILKIISILSIVFIGLGFLDFLFYAQKQNIPLSLSFLTASNLEVLIILPILLAIFVLIIPLFVAVSVYISIEDKSFNWDLNLDNIFHIVSITIIECPSLCLFGLLFSYNKGHFLILFIGYVILLMAISYFILFKSKSKSKSNGIKSENNNWLFSLFVITFIIILVILFHFSFNKNSNYLLDIVSYIYFLFSILPFLFYIYKYFNKDSVKNGKYFFLVIIFFIILIFGFLSWIIVKKSSTTFKMLNIGGNIQMNLLISQKYFNEITRHNTSNNAINNLKWYKFKLLLKTSNSYYVKLLNNNKKIFIIPVKYIYSESYNTKTKTKKNNKINKMSKQINNITTLYLVLGPNKCDLDIGYNRQYCGHFNYGYFYN